MSNVFTLESLREEAEKKFGSVKIELDETKTVTLRNLLRLSKPEKKSIMDQIDLMDSVKTRAKAIADKAKSDEPSSDDDADIAEPDVDEMFDAMREILKIAADKHGALLISKIGGDDTLVSTLFEEWMNTAQLGEAKSSPTN